jgi:large subunit ribosomal protein L6
MSRVGRKPVALPQGVQVNVKDGKLQVKGPKGDLHRVLHPDVSVKVDKGAVHVERKREDREGKALHGLTRALLNNMVLGVTKGWERSLEINGVGYRAEVKGQKLSMTLGFSHPIDYDLPKGVSAKVDKNIITLMAADRELLGETAAKVRSFRPPEPYKGKGVKYVEETIRRKVGKTGAA